MKPTYVTFYTEGTFYEKVTEELVESLRKHNLQYKVYARPNLKTWDLNVRQKPHVILQALEEHTTPIVWIDADAVIQKYPDLFDRLDCDFACHVRTRQGFSIFGATLYFGNTPLAKEFVKDWIERTDRKEKELDIEIPAPYRRISTVWSFADQGPLANAYWTFALSGKPLRFYELPKSYAVKYNSRHDDRVILQNQISRNYKQMTEEWNNEAGR